MEKIKFEDVTSNYNSYEEFVNDCIDKNILMGAFYIDNIIYEYGKYNNYTDSYHHVKIPYIIFDPRYHCILERCYLIPVRKDDILIDFEITKLIRSSEFHRFDRYIRNYYEGSKINYIDDYMLEIEYLWSQTICEYM